MIDTVHAVTWAEHYVFPGHYTVKVCKYSRRFDLHYYWAATRTLITLRSRKACYNEARRVAKRLDVPLLKDVKQGTRLTLTETLALSITDSSKRKNIINRST